MVALQQDYVHRIEDKIGSLEVVENGTKVRVLGGTGKNRPAIIPTTEELMAYVREPETLRRIALVQEDALQRAEEKVAIAEQNYGLIDNICKRLDSDLEEMKGFLQTAGEFQKPGTAKPNDLAAMQVPGSQDWILGKVISHDAQTGMYRLSDEDIESNKSKLWQRRSHWRRMYHSMSQICNLPLSSSFQSARGSSCHSWKFKEFEPRRCCVCSLSGYHFLLSGYRYSNRAQGQWWW